MKNKLILLISIFLLLAICGCSSGEVPRIPSEGPTNTEYITPTNVTVPFETDPTAPSTTPTSGGTILPDHEL